VTLVTLSLNHLAHGITVVKLCQDWEGLEPMAGEVAMVATAGTKAAKSVARFANPALITAFAWSAGLNAFAFSAGTSALWMTVTAASLGASIPALIYAGTRIWAALTIESRRAAQ
jgi:hypothetical protein